MANNNDKLEEAHKKSRSSERTLRIMNTSLNEINRFIKRLNRIDNPETKYSFIVHYFNTIIDIGLAVVLPAIENEDYSECLEEDRKMLIDKRESIMKSMEETRDTLDGVFDKMIVWITQLSYGPDSNMGKQIMQDAEEEFHSKCVPAQ